MKAPDSIKRIKIPIYEFSTDVVRLWAKRWLLLSAGDFEKGDFNAMTVAWGSVGYLWNRPYAEVFARPTRYTYEFLERYPTFTLTAFEERHREALKLLGTKSGRDGDKIAEAGLTPVASERVAAPSFAEATLAIECEKMYWHDIDPARFLSDDIDPLYNDDYHRAYFGKILGVFGAERERTA